MKAVALLLSILAIPFVIATVVGRVWPQAYRTRAWRGRLSLTIMFIVTGAAHFWFGTVMTQMLPGWVPGRLWIIWISGVCEIAGALALQSTRWRRPAAYGLIALLIGVFPANIYAAYCHIDLGGHGMGPSYLLIRVPLQLFLIGLLYGSAVRSKP